MDQKDIENLRQDYNAASLNETDVDANPMRQFDKWFNEAINFKSTRAKRHDAGYRYARWPPIGKDCAA
jgi:pyridoxine/pyridoxamine 5'-phosphate oxidase